MWKRRMIERTNRQPGKTPKTTTKGGPLWHCCPEVYGKEKKQPLHKKWDFWAEILTDINCWFWLSIRTLTLEGRERPPQTTILSNRGKNSQYDESYISLDERVCICKSAQTKHANTWIPTPTLLLQNRGAINSKIVPAVALNNCVLFHRSIILSFSLFPKSKAHNETRTRGQDVRECGLDEGNMRSLFTWEESQQFSNEEPELTSKLI